MKAAGLTELIDKVLTGFNTIVNLFQLSADASEKKKDGQSASVDAPSQDKPGVLARWTLEDESIWLEILTNLKQPEKDSIHLLESVVPPHGDDLIANMLRNQALQQFRLVVTRMSVEKQKTDKTAVTEVPGANGKKTTTTTKSAPEKTLKDRRTLFLQQIAAEIGTDETVAKKVYKKLVLDNVFPNDPTTTIKAVDAILANPITVKPHYLDESRWTDYVPFIGLWLSKKAANKSQNNNP